MTYLIIKSLHIISVITWMAGLLYLPRLFVYHSEANIGSEFSEKLKIMEKKLSIIIIFPSMILTWFFGLALVFHNESLVDTGEKWFFLKIILVILLTIIQIFFEKLRKDFSLYKNTHKQNFYRWANELPTVLMVLIVFLVVMKP